MTPPRRRWKSDGGDGAPADSAGGAEAPAHPSSPSRPVEDTAALLAAFSEHSAAFLNSFEAGQKNMLSLISEGGAGAVPLAAVMWACPFYRSQ